MELEEGLTTQTQYWYIATNMRAILRYSHKVRIQDRYLMELLIHEVPRTRAQPLGLKYRLICIDLTTGAKVLMDNHHPKGPHVHIDDRELPYEFAGEEKLVSDFKEIVLDKMGISL